MDDADRAERVAALVERADRAVREERQRRAALGTGLCLDCGSDIPAERRHARPGAIRCVSCQAAHEAAIR